MSNLATLWGGPVGQHVQGGTDPQGLPPPHAPGGPLARAHPIERSESRHDVTPRSNLPSQGCARHVWQRRPRPTFGERRGTPLSPFGGEEGWLPGLGGVMGVVAGVGWGLVGVACGMGL